MEVGWYPNDSAIYYTDETGINLWYLNKRSPDILIGGQEENYCICWAEDGSAMVYKTGNSKNKGNSLFIFDLKTKKSQKIDSIKSGVYEEGFFSSDRSSFTVCVNYGKDEDCTIKKIDLVNRKDCLVWKDTGCIYDLINLDDNDRFLLRRGKYNNVYYLLFNGSTIDTVFKGVEILEYNKINRTFLVKYPSDKYPKTLHMDEFLYRG